MDEARIVHGGIYGAETTGLDVVDRRTELGVIEEIEELGAEVQAHPFARQRELFDYGEVGVDEIGADGWDARGIAQLAGSGCGEAGCIDPLQLAVVRVGGVATGDPVGPVPVISVAAILEEGAGLIIAVDQRNRESGGDSLDQRHLEVAHDRVGHLIPTAAELLSAADGQIVNDTAREAVCEMDLR